MIPSLTHIGSLFARIWTSVALAPSEAAHAPPSSDASACRSAWPGDGHRPTDREAVYLALIHGPVPF